MKEHRNNIIEVIDNINIFVFMMRFHMKNDRHIKPIYYFIVVAFNFIWDFIGFWINYVAIGFMVTTTTSGGFFGGDGSITSVVTGLFVILTTCICSFLVNKKIYKKYINRNCDDLFFLIPLMIFNIVAVVYPANLCLI
jgi:hypothetical protein